MGDIIAAVIENEDSLAIEIIEEIGVKLGRYLSMLINIFNPELVVLGGPLAEVGSYLYLPIRTTINKYSLNIVSQDMQLKVSTLGSKSGVIGACYILRNKFLSTL
jgi:predicted NBD/HSP70 family sugar kinase